MGTPSADTILNRFALRAKFRHLQVLIKLAELGSMRRAAAAMNMTQPAVSQKVSELERLIEAELFFRHAKGVEPTAVTKDLLPVARRILSALQDGSEVIASRISKQSGLVRVSASQAAVGGLLSGALGAFSKAHPDIQVNLLEHGGSSPLDDLVDEAADVVCTREPEIIPTGWQFMPCLEDRLVAVCGKNHELSGRKSISGEELGEHVWLMNRIGSVARQCFEEVASSFDWPEKVRCKLIVHIPNLTLEFLKDGDRLAILPESVARPWLRESAVEVLETVISRELPPLGLLFQEEAPSHAVQSFTKFIAKAAK